VINTPGQSGPQGSPHYSDLLPLWNKDQYFPLLYSRKG
jgi:penicillin G amidase